ncbi:radical SAM protein [uncultured Eubacterium sp.]|uniref:B12-binding domain-containing radical SAM protein n=1 Tax=uncultured Eubacterium sp. TaxID=165185 RepID=UPI003263A467
MKALIVQVNETLETNIALVYKTVFIGETASVLKKLGVEVEVCDATIEGYNLNEIIKKFCTHPDLVIFVTDVQQARITKRVAEVCKLCFIKSKIMVIGRATSFIPQYFMREPFDSVHINGDREAAIISYVKYLRGEINKEEIANIFLLENNEKFISSQVKWLDSQDWNTPELSLLPIESYQKLNQKQHPDRKLVVGVTSMKGCTYGCKYCGASLEEGNIVRYGKVNKILEWGQTIPFDAIVQLWSPNIMNSIEWLQKFIDAYEIKECNFSWRGVARMESIDEEKVQYIYQHNCNEIAVGVEMIRKKTHNSLKGSELQLLHVIELLKKYNINLKCLLMLGYPGYEIEDVIYTIKFLKKYSVNYRITGYTPLHNLTHMSIEELESIMIENYDRRLYYNNCNIDSGLFYQILSSNGEILL